MTPELFALIVGLIAACGLLFAGIALCAPSRNHFRHGAIAELRRTSRARDWDAFANAAWRARHSRGA